MMGTCHCPALGDCQVQGQTDSSGARVTVAALFCKFCQSMDIDPKKENNSPIGRPTKIANGGRPVPELFG